MTINKVAAGAITRSRLLLNTVIATFAAGAAVIPAHGYRAYNLSLGTPATGVTVGPTIDDVNLHEALTIEVRVAGDGVPTGDWPLLMPKIYADASGANGLFWLILVNPKGTDVSPNGLEIRIEFLRRV